MHQELFDAYLSALELRQRVRPGSSTPVATEPLRLHLEQTALLRISVRLDPDMPKDRLCGFVARERHQATIVVSGKLNSCWRRFVVLKELMHLAADTKSSYVRMDEIQHLLMGLVTPSEREVSPQLASESRAFCMALVYSLPPEHRPPNLNSVTAHEVASVFGIPQLFVELFYSRMAPALSRIDDLIRLTKPTI